MLSPGARVGPFEVLSSLGAGGMGEVYRARDPRLEREIALKVLPAETLADGTARARMVREARMAARLNHPNVCAIHEVGEADGRVYIAMELVQGRSLASILAAGALPVEQALRYGARIADALAHAHERGIVHRDLKSANIVITPEGRAKVLDFGLAKPLADEALAEAATRDDPTLTGPGALVGTLAYMAPEQLRGQPADARSDIWALGVVLYEMLGGRRPFEAHTGYELSAAILNEAPPPLPASVPPALQAVVRRCLSKAPGERFQRAEEVRAALETVESGGAISFAPARVLAVRRRRWTMVAAAALATVVATLAALDVGGVRQLLLGGGRDHARAIRMAVLPFANLSGDPEQEYLADGLTQEMIAQLGRLHPETLSVIARTSVMRYKKADTPIDQIGRELGVQYVLEGGAQKEGGRVRVSAELIQVNGQAQLWADTFEHELADTLVLESEVARSVAGALALRLLPAERARLAGARAVNPEAYDAYLKGSEYWTRLTAADLDAAERCFDLALEKDPSFARAHAGRAMVWFARLQMGFTPPSEAGPKAKAAARRAVALDETVAEGHTALASILQATDWDFPAAGREWARAVELDPSNALARAGFSGYLMVMKRADEAMAQIEAALKGDPFNEIVRTIYGASLMNVGRYEDALVAARGVLRLQPEEIVALQVCWLSSARLGRHSEAVEAARGYAAAIYHDPDAERACDEGYAAGGYREAMRRLAESLAARSLRSFVLHSDVACFFVEAGDKASALDHLEKAYEQRDPGMQAIGLEPFDTLRAEPRYQALLRKMNLAVDR